ncbi:MAG: ScpA family protein [Pseudomonadota bacterium]
MASLETHIAKIYGQPLEHLPKNLFIPPDALAIMLESFEGPLDLLWYLIRHHRLDVRDIPMQALADQYLAYIEALKKHTLELAAEYLLMAAWLVEIKARMLLPQPTVTADDMPEEDPRAALVLRLLEYERIRQGAKSLAALPKMGEHFESVSVESPETLALLPTIKAEQLHKAWIALLERQAEPMRHVIEREAVSLRDVMSSVMRDLPTRGEVGWESLLVSWESKPFYAVSVMLALLQLMRERTVFGQQDRPLGAWWVARHPIHHIEPAPEAEDKQLVELQPQ